MGTFEYATLLIIVLTAILSVGDAGL
jgi:hypothetical protein